MRERERERVRACVCEYVYVGKEGWKCVFVCVLAG